VEDSLASGNATFIGINAAIEGQAKAVNRSLSSVKKTLASGRREQVTLLRLQKVSNSKVMNRLDDVCSTLTQQIAMIRLTEGADNGIVFEGENLAAITLPLMLMQTDLTKAVEHWWQRVLSRSLVLKYDGFRKSSQSCSLVVMKRRRWLREADIGILVEGLLRTTDANVRLRLPSQDISKKQRPLSQ
jgi:hypothetical protein